MENGVYKSYWKDIGGIKVFIDVNNLSGENKKFSKLYNRIAPFYHISQKIFYKIKYSNIKTNITIAL